LKFYREKLFTELNSVIKRSVTLRRTYKSSPISEDIKQTENVNKAAGLKYHPGPYPGRVILFKAQRGPYNTYPSNGWDQVKIGELLIHELDCYHGSILFEPAVIHLAEILNNYIG
jgi:thioesterase domain-containing protein